MIDRDGLQGTLEFISDICLDKADHIATSWQDEYIATRWVIAASLLNDIATTKCIKEVDKPNREKP